MKVLCLPCAGSSATMYYRWKQSVPSWLHITPLELAGRGARLNESHRESFPEQLADIHRTYAHEFTGDYVIFGHSMGGLLAYGMAHLLQENPPKAIFISACGIPNQKKSDFFTTSDDATLIDVLKKQNGTPQVVFEHPELLQMLLTNLKADLKVCSGFITAPHAIDIPIHLLAGRSDSIHELSLMAWQKHTTVDISINWFDGDHFYIQPSQCEQEFLSCLTNHIQRYISRTSYIN